ncbi:MAG: SDR family oxidoreductase [candidate division Zixibacteria bacterium]|nr:SDR family oxidoreductase [candidate division Zixibacteria bacterium]
MAINVPPQRVAVTGASGLLGRALVTALAARGHTVTGGYRELPPPLSAAVTPLKLDLLKAESIAGFVGTARPDCVIHAAALTDVDRCEQNSELARAGNATSVQFLMKALAGAGCRIILLSTDYVFDGKDGPYDESAVPNPINVYGRTKLAAEEVVKNASAVSVIVRSASFLGIGAYGRPTWAEKLVTTMLEHPPLRAAIDQRSNITPIEFLAAAIADIVETRLTGLYHVAGKEILSRYEFALKLARLFGQGDDAIQAVSYRDLNRPAPRPLNGGLATRFPLRTPQIPLDVALVRWKTQFEQARS